MTIIIAGRLPRFDDSKASSACLLHHLVRCEARSVQAMTAPGRAFRFKLKTTRNVVQSNEPPGGDVLRLPSIRLKMFKISISVRVSISAQAITMLLCILHSVAQFERSVRRTGCIAPATMASRPSRRGPPRRYLGHKSISNTIRYIELAPTRFKDLWR